MNKIKNTILVNGKRKVCRIWDNQGETLDRYTIAFKGYKLKYKRNLSRKALDDYYATRDTGLIYPYLGCNTAPFQGIGYHGESREFLTGKHLGRRASFESLPVDVQRFISQSI